MTWSAAHASAETYNCPECQLTCITEQHGLKPLRQAVEHSSLQQRRAEAWVYSDERKHVQAAWCTQSDSG